MAIVAPSQVAIIGTAEVQRLLAAVTAEKQRLASLLNSIGDEVWFADIEGRFTLANPAGLNEFGLAVLDKLDVKEMVAGLEVYRGDGSLRPVEETPALRALAGEVIRGEDETVRTPGTGELRHRRVSSTPVRDGDGRIIGSVSVARDVTDRKCAEDTLRDSEARFRTICETSPLGIIFTDLNLNTVYSNEAQQRICGFSALEQAGQNWRVAIHPEDLERVIREWQEIRRTTRSFRSERRYRHKDGKIVWAGLTAAPIRDKTGVRGYVGIVEDITERKRSEEEVRESEAKQRLFLQHAPASIAVLDAQMHYVTTSQRWLSDFGLQGQILRGRSHYDVLPEIPERWKEIHRRCLAGAVERAEEDPFERADGRVQWLRWEIRPWYAGSGVVGGLIIFCEDITKRKIAESALAENRERLDLALASAKIATFEWDIVNNRRKWDANVHRLLGTDPATFAGSAEEFFRIIHPDDRESMRQALAGAIEMGTLETEYRAVLPDGAIRHVASRGNVHRDASGRAVRMTGITWDITARKQAEEEIRMLNQELESRVVERTSELQAAVGALEMQIAERQRLEREILEISEREKSRVGQDLHDGLCQTLAGIGFLARALQRNLEEEKLPVGTAVAKADTIANLLKEAINEARGLAAGMYPVNIEEYGLAPALEKLAADTAQRFRINCKFKCAESVVLADTRAAAHLYRITQEAVSNAIRHGGAGLVQISLGTAGGQITLKIEDDGMGQLKDMEPTGMGLKTMNYRARSIGGSLDIWQRPPHGIAVVCSFPNQHTPGA